MDGNPWFIGFYKNDTVKHDFMFTPRHNAIPVINKKEQIEEMVQYDYVSLQKQKHAVLIPLNTSDRDELA